MSDAAFPAYLAPGQLQNADVLNDFNFDDPALASYLGGDTSFDIDNTDLTVDDLVDDIHEKRKVEDEDDLDDENDTKRLEGEDKQAKKPGRKPLTSEPTTKRKAQNRAAQRAFRERKEKHLKDLETKVSELTKTSETEKQQNGLLRAQVARLQNELSDYRKRLAADSGSRVAATGIPSSNITYPQRNEFAFEFPVFGQLPSSQFPIKRESNDSPKGLGSLSREGSVSQNGSKPAAEGSRHGSNASKSNGVQNFAGLFSPGILNSAVSSSSPDYGFPGAAASPTAPVNKDDGTPNSGIARAFRFNSESAASNTDSPSQSSMSQFNPTSSCDTSPAPSHPSPPKDSVPSANPGLASTDMSSNNSLASPSTLNGIDWLASQNGGQFDPVLFGDYRESQDAIVGDGEFNNGFFNEAFPFDFGSPFSFNTTKSPQPLADTLQQLTPATAVTTNQQQQLSTADATKSAACKKLLEQVDRNVSDGDDSFGVQGKGAGPFAPSVANLGPAGSMLSANTIWNQLQANKDFQDGKFDLDGLCSELRSKAKCSESGIVVPDNAVKDAFKKMSGGEKLPHKNYLLFDEAFVDQAVENLGGEKVDWGGFGLDK